MKRYSGIIVRNEDKYLLCKRNYEGNLPGVWSVPGGHMEDNETPEECARREFFEETNYKIDDRLNLVGFIEHTNNEDEMKGLMYVYFYDSDDEINPDLRNAKDGDEHLVCNYFSFDDLPLEKNDQLYKIIKKLN